MKPAKFLAAPVAAVVMLSGLAACGSKSSTGKGSDALPKSALNVMDRDKIKDGGNVNMVVNGLAENWNPYNAAGNEVDYSQIRLPLGPNWIKTDENGKTSLNKDFLADAKAETKAGKTVITVKMNDKAKWSDGKDFTLADWTNTWHANSGKDPKFNIVSSEGWDQIEKVEQGADADTFVITMKATYPDWEGLISGGPMRAESVKDAATFNDGWKDLKKASDAGWFSGPFIVSKVDKGNSVVEVPNPNWWGDKPKLDTITWLAKDPTSWAAAYTNGELDAFDIGVNADAYARAKGYTEGEIRRSNSQMWRHITFNTKAASLQDKAVRRAIVQYLDRAQIAKSDLAGMDMPNVTPLNGHVFMQGQDGYKDLGEETGLKFDQAAAEKTMTDAGYKKGSDGIWAKDGKPVAVKFTTLSGVKVSENEGKQVQDQLSKFGIKVTLAPVPSDQMSPTLDKRAFEMIAFTWAGTPFPYNAPKQFFGPDSQSNFTGYKPDAKAQELLKTISTEMDPTKRKAAVNDLEKLVWDDPQILPLYQRPQQEAVKKGLANFGAYGLVTPWAEWQNVGWAK